MYRPSSLRHIVRSVRNLLVRPSVELDPAAAYELWAPTYDNSSDNALLHVEAPIVRRLLEQADLRDKCILDAGCGTGRHLETIQKMQPQLIAGVDLSPAMLQFAVAKVNSNISTSFYVASVENLPFQDRTFDFVLSTLVLAHVQDLQAGIAELSRVMRNGATLLISCVHPFGKLLSWKRTFQSRTPSGKSDWLAVKYSLHLYADYFNALKLSGMEIIHIQEPVIDETSRPFYLRAGRMDMFGQFKGYPMLLILVARKQ